MNFDSIANLVHECVKNPKILIQQNGAEEKKVMPGEFSVIQNVFSRYEVSGGTVAFIVEPLGDWV
ncbi:MAG: hypothetical protein GX434_04995 [Peptococcaceae bacterium]|nr:hypothetical protein [Peptococcaceae bacterium]